jgi:hypothetical protein
MSILVIGCPIEDFEMQKGWHFSFLNCLKGYSIVRKTINEWKFKEYFVSNNISFSLLQFADDPILICEKFCGA